MTLARFAEVLQVCAWAFDSEECEVSVVYRPGWWSHAVLVEGGHYLTAPQAEALAAQLLAAAAELRAKVTP